MIYFIFQILKKSSMALHNEIVDEIISIFKEKVENSVNDTDMLEEDKEAFVDRYVQAFRQVNKTYLISVD